ncbi:MAG TPA: hypothetical protein GX506_05600 [Firmicutes bacterium]|nr:hypothetical protein [Bacillota bacterium]
MDLRDCLLGIDVGTTHIKAVIFDPSGKEITKTVLDTPKSVDEKGWTTMDPEAIWDTTARAVSETISLLRPDGWRIAGIATASMGESGVPLDRHGDPIYPIIAWYDLRTEPQARWWDETVGRARTVAITGLGTKPMYSAPKILWILQNVDRARARLATWLPVSDFIAYKLTGNQATDFSQASRTMLFDQARRDWSGELLQLSGIPGGILPAAVPSGTLVGHVHSEASRKTQIPQGTPVFAGGHDHVCGALAAGAISPGRVLDSCGTAESILVSCQNAGIAQLACSSGFSFGHHVVRDTHYVMGGIPSSGGAIEWFIQEFCRENRSYQAATDLARESPPGSHGVIFVPRLLGSGPPTRDKDATGAFARIHSGTTLSDFARSIFEGLSFELKLAIEAMERVLAQEISSLIAIGGGAKNDFWLSIKASALGIPIEVPEVTESTALGAALLAGIGAGLYRDEMDAVKKTSRISARFAPEETLKQVYQDQYAAFSAIAEALYRIDKERTTTS